MITNYTDLQSTVIAFADRTDLTSTMPMLVRLAEDVIYTDLDARQQDVKATLTTTANVETVALPSDFMTFRGLSVNMGARKETLTYLTPTQYSQEFSYDTAGQPRAYTLIGSDIYLQPIPDAVYNLNAVYEAKLTNLSASNPTNWLITAYPSAYLYACLMQVSLYIKDDVGLEKWSALYKKIIDGINSNDANNGNTLQVRTDVNLTSYRP